MKGSRGRGVPEPGAASRVRVPLMMVTDQALRVYGLDGTDLLQYRRYCNRRLRRIRKVLVRGRRRGLTKAKPGAPPAGADEAGGSDGRPSPTAAASILELLFLAERARTYSLLLKDEGLHPDDSGRHYDGRRKLIHARGRRRRAQHWARQLVTRCKLVGDALTVLEAQVYFQHLVGSSLLDLGLWRDAQETFEQAADLARRLCSGAPSVEEHALFQQRQEEIEAAMRFCTYRGRLLPRGAAGSGQGGSARSGSGDPLLAGDASLGSGGGGGEGGRPLAPTSASSGLSATYLFSRSLMVRQKASEILVSDVHQHSGRFERLVWCGYPFAVQTPELRAGLLTAAIGLVGLDELFLRSYQTLQVWVDMLTALPVPVLPDERGSGSGERGGGRPSASGGAGGAAAGVAVATTSSDSGGPSGRKALSKIFSRIMEQLDTVQSQTSHVAERAATAAAAHGLISGRSGGTTAGTTTVLQLEEQMVSEALYFLGRELSLLRHEWLLNELESQLFGWRVWPRERRLRRSVWIQVFQLAKARGRAARYVAEQASRLQAQEGKLPVVARFRPLGWEGAHITDGVDLTSVGLPTRQPGIGIGLADYGLAQVAASTQTNRQIPVIKALNKAVAGPAERKQAISVAFCMLQVLSLRSQLLNVRWQAQLALWEARAALAEHNWPGAASALDRAWRVTRGFDLAKLRQGLVGFVKRAGDPGYSAAILEPARARISLLGLAGAVAKRSAGSSHVAGPGSGEAITSGASTGAPNLGQAVESVLSLSDPGPAMQHGVLAPELSPQILPLIFSPVLLQGDGFGGMSRRVVLERVRFAVELATETLLGRLAAGLVDHATALGGRLAGQIVNTWPLRVTLAFYPIGLVMMTLLHADPLVHVFSGVRSGSPEPLNPTGHKQLPEALVAQLVAWSDEVWSLPALAQLIQTSPASLSSLPASADVSGPGSGSTTGDGSRRARRAWRAARWAGTLITDFALGLPEAQLVSLFRWALVNRARLAPANPFVLGILSARTSISPRAMEDAWATITHHLDGSSPTGAQSPLTPANLVAQVRNLFVAYDSWLVRSPQDSLEPQTAVFYPEPDQLPQIGSGSRAREPKKGVVPSESASDADPVPESKSEPDGKSELVVEPGSESAPESRPDAEDKPESEDAPDAENEPDTTARTWADLAWQWTAGWF